MRREEEGGGGREEEAGIMRLYKYGRMEMVHKNDGGDR